MEESLQQETEKLTRAWAQRDAATLRDYLVADVEDPRLNVQSILTRHFLIAELFGHRFLELMDQELWFAIAMNWLLAISGKLSCGEECGVVVHGLRQGADDAEGIRIPGYARQLFRALPAVANGVTIPNYLESALAAMQREPARPRLPADSLRVFQLLWSRALAGERRPPPRPSVLEVACGSANDYRFFEAFGLRRLIDYTGLDLCQKNVDNARTMFPQARFEVGNVFALAAADRAFDYCVAQDLFEHLSLEGVHAAVREVCRVTRRGLCLGFFSMDEIPDNVVRPVGEYHWNTLSVARMRELFARHGFETQAVHIRSFLKALAGCDEIPNPTAYTLRLYAR